MEVFNMKPIQLSLCLLLVFSACKEKPTAPEDKPFAVTNVVWEQTSLDSVSISCLALSGTEIFAGNADNAYYKKPSGVFVSSDNGTDWTQTTLDSVAVSAFCVVTTAIYAATDHGVFRSTDSGAGWTLVNGSACTSLAVSGETLAFSGSRIFAGTEAGVFVSTNNGASWTQTSLDSVQVNALVVSGSNLFAGTWMYGVFLSTDNGETWKGVNTGLTFPFVSSLAVDGANIFAGTASIRGGGSGVFKGTMQ
jgi:hypothetical protein